MKKLKYLLILVGAAVIMQSCDDTVYSDQFDDGPNLAGFVNGSQSVNVVADGQEYPRELQMEVKGPTSMELASDITATVTVDAASTAVEGVHFRLDNPTITLSASNNHLALFGFTILSTGIDAPSSPVAVLKVTATSGDGNVIGNGKPINVTINYGCPSDLAGTYDLVVNYTPVGGTGSTPYFFVDNIVETDIGTYRTTIDHHWGSLGVGTPGFTFYDVCDVISGPGQYLAEYYGNWVDFIEGTHDNGTINMTYSICFPAGDPDNCRYYNNTWVKQ